MDRAGAGGGLCPGAAGAPSGTPRVEDEAGGAVFGSASETTFSPAPASGSAPEEGAWYGLFAGGGQMDTVAAAGPVSAFNSGASSDCRQGLGSDHSDGFGPWPRGPGRRRGGKT